MQLAASGALIGNVSRVTRRRLVASALARAGIEPKHLLECARERSQPDGSVKSDDALDGAST